MDKPSAEFYIHWKACRLYPLDIPSGYSLFGTQRFKLSDANECVV
jgi:hypothetical protein